jgi:formate hydrogenlyase subunit 3/multisubunit Na+/H+ antiporter MnhD subunit
MSAVEAGYFGLASLAALVSIVTLAYYLKFQTFVFFAKPKENLTDIKEVPLSMTVSMIILAVICLLSGLLLTPALRPFLERGADVLLSGTNYQTLILGALK